MGSPSPAPERVGSGLLWGLGFSIAFHAVLFSPQLSAWLQPEAPTVLAAEPRKAKDAPKPDERKPDERTPDARKPEERTPNQPEPPKEKPPADSPPQPPAEEPPADPSSGPPPLPPELTPTPVPAYPDVEDVAIGQDEGDPMSVVIIGRDDFEEHMAQLSVVSQAGFRMSDAGGDGTVAYGRGDRGDGGGGGGSAPNATATTVAAATPGAPATPESTRVESAAASPPPEAASQPNMPASQPEAPAVPLVRPEPKPEPKPEPAPPVPPQPPITVPPPAEPAPTPTPEPATTPAEDGTPKPPAAPPEEPKPAPTEQPKPAPPTVTPAVTPEPKPAPQPPANQPPATQQGGGIASTERPKDGSKTDAPGDAGKAGGSGPSPKPGTGGKGQLSDLESPATSVTQVDAKLWKNGRLVAAQGIQLKPRQPQFTTLQLVSLLPGCRPPVVSLTFDGTGKCVDVFFNLSSGDSEIDGVIRNSLFFWRAAGKKIDALKDGEKVRVTLQLLL